MTMKAGHGVF